ncbi:MAG TPA: hypothetical protein VI792_04360 [Candidatus Eisenbacteria bacterium]
MKLALPAGLALGLLALASPARAQMPAFADTGTFAVDAGSFRIVQSGHMLGTEVFSYSGRGDSMLVVSRTFQVLSSGDTLRKDVSQVVSLLDFGLRNYHSKQTFGGHTLTRGLEMGDTTYMSFRQMDEQGVGDMLVLPPGRMFILDPKMFVCFDLICRSLHKKVFDTWPLTLLVLGPRDSVLAATATDLGSETIRWGSKPVQAHKFNIGDANTTFTAWAGPAGSMLRLEEGTTGLRVERDAPAVKARPRPPKPSP